MGDNHTSNNLMAGGFPGPSNTVGITHSRSRSILTFYVFFFASLLDITARTQMVQNVDVLSLMNQCDAS